MLARITVKQSDQNHNRAGLYCLNACSERGIWVLRTGKPMTGRETEEVLRSVREERVRKAFGESP